MQKKGTYLFVPLLTDRAADLYYLTFNLHVLGYEMATIISNWCSRWPLIVPNNINNFMSNGLHSSHFHSPT